MALFYVSDGCQAVGRGVQPPQPAEEGRHLHDVRLRVPRTRREASLPRGALHRRRLHQVQLQLGLRRQQGLSPDASGLQPLHLREVRTRTDRRRRSGRRRSLHRSANSHR